MPQYLKVLRTPEPNSSTRPISLKKLAITGFFGNGEKGTSGIRPLNPFKPGNESLENRNQNQSNYRSHATCKHIIDIESAVGYNQLQCFK